MRGGCCGGGRGSIGDALLRNTCSRGVEMYIGVILWSKTYSSKNLNVRIQVSFFFMDNMMLVYMYVCEKWMNTANYIIFQCIYIENLEVLILEESVELTLSDITGTQAKCSMQPSRMKYTCIYGYLSTAVFCTSWPPSVLTLKQTSE